MKLHLYFARRFLTTFLLVAGVFFGILVLIELVEQLRRFADDGVSFIQAVGLTLLIVPRTFHAILPLVMVLATVTLFLSLARSSEMVVTRASGRSALHSLLAPVAVAALLGALAIAILNPIVAATSKRYEIAANNFRSGVESVLSVSREGLWLRQAGTEGQVVIRAERANLDGTELHGVTFLGFDEWNVPSYRIEARRAELIPGAWQVFDAKRWSFAGENPEREAATLPMVHLPSDLTSRQIADSFGTPSAIPIWELPRFIANLDQAGFSARAHRVWLQMELAQPLMLAAMVLIGAGFTMRHTRFGRTGLMVLFALSGGFALYFIRNFAQVLGESGQLPVALAAWGPPLAAVLLPLGLLLHLEDG